MPANTGQGVIPQSTGQSTNTLDAAYDNVFSTLDLLGSGPSLSLDNPNTPPPPSPPTSSGGSQSEAVTAFTSPHEASPASSQTTPRARDRSEVSVDRLTVVSERTEPESPVSSRPTTPTARGRRGFSSRSISPAAPPGSLRPGIYSTTSSLPFEARYPLPDSPVKVAGSSTAGGGNTSPTKASDLIRLFENRTGPQTTAPPPPIFNKTASNWVSQPLRTYETPTQAAPPPPSSFKAPPPSSSEVASPSSGSYATALPLSPPAKPPSPLASVRTLIASWRARSGSPSQRVIGSPGRGRTSPKVFGRDGGWNVSIRRRRRHEGREEEALAEQETEETPHVPAPLSTLSEVVDAAIAEEEAVLGLDTGRTASVRSSRSHGSSSVAPRPLTGEVSKYPTPSCQCANNPADPHR
jgi:hypothetical protein